MDINLTTNSSINSGHTNQKTESEQVSIEVSADQIRTIRDSFEKESQHLEETLGSDAHRTMLMAMYEGTENLLDKRISQFEIIEYLEALKVNAQELHNRGLSQQEFRTEILRQSQNTVFSMIKSI